MQSYVFNPDDSTLRRRFALIQLYFDACQLIDDLEEAKKTIEDCNFYHIDVDLDCRSYSARLMEFTQRISFGKKFYKDDYNGELIKKRLNYLQDYLNEHNRALYTYEKRDEFGTALAKLASPKFIDVQVLEEATTGAVKALAQLLFSIGSEIHYFKPEKKHFENIFNYYVDYYENKSVFNTPRVLYLKAKEKKFIENDYDELCELRTSFFVDLVKSGFFLDHYDDMTASITKRLSDEVNFSFAEESEEDLHLDKCYALFRKMVDYDGKQYNVKGHKIGKYLYDNRKELDAYKIDALFLHLGLLGEVQKDMFPKDGSASVAKHNTDYPTSCEVLDPTLQSYFLRKEKFAEIAKVLNETIKPNVEATGNKANWDYVCYAFKVLGIVKINLSRKKVASLLVAMCPGIGEASTLESSMEKSSASYQGKYDYEKLKETEQLKIHSKPYIEALQPVV